MTAAGKITAARVSEGDRILVKHYSQDVEADRGTLEYLGVERALGISTTKTGTGVTVARVLKVEAATVQGGRRAARVYDIHTTEGVLKNNVAHQTMLLAPEDAAAVKRALKEATLINDSLVVETETVAADVFAEIHPDAVVAHAERPSSSTPEPGWSSQCRKATCPGHWRTGMETAAEARAAYEAHPCGAAELTEAQADVDALLEELKLDAQEFQVSPGDAPADAFATVEELEEKHYRPTGVNGAATPAAADERLRLAEARLAQAELTDYQEATADIHGLKPETAVGTPAGEESAPGRRDRAVRGDVVRIHRGTALYEVLRVEHDRALDRTKPGSEPEDFSMAHLAPLDPDSDGRLRWESLDLLHRVPPAARVTTLPVGPRLELAEDFVAVAGGGWTPDLGHLRQPSLIYVDGSRVPEGRLAQVPLEVLEDGTVVPVGVLKVGDAIVISGRCFTVTWDGDGEPSLVPQRWRDR